MSTGTDPLAGLRTWFDARIYRPRNRFLLLVEDEDEYEDDDEYDLINLKIF